MNRGRESRRRPELRPARRFNEAPIHESGKGDAISSLGYPGPRFNEAPIHESGKARHVSDAEPHGLASMRPRFMNRGRKSTISQTSFMIVLQ